MHHPTPRTMKALAASLGALLMLSACATSEPSSTTELSAAGPEAAAVATAEAVTAADSLAAAAEPADSPGAASITLPAVEVIDLASGQTTSLDTLAASGPVLLWFWAPS